MADGDDGDYGFTDDPWESGIPGSNYGEEGDIYNDFLQDMDIASDEFAAGLLFEGWFNDDASADERHEAREMLFDYLDLDSYDFDWDAWRDYMGYED